MNFKQEPPSTKALKQHFIDGNYQTITDSMLDCAAHMILAIENPTETVRIALSYLGGHLNACRADAGFAVPTDREYTPLAEYCSEDSKPPSVANFLISNQHEVMQRVWRSRTPVKEVVHWLNMSLLRQIRS